MKVLPFLAKILVYNWPHSSRKDTFTAKKYRYICYGYSLQVPRQGTSNEFPQQMFSGRNKKWLCEYTLLSGAMGQFEW